MRSIAGILSRSTLNVKEIKLSEIQ
ncbi:hypothetical protein SAMN02746093_01611 [Legionella quinlivanii DSM 21216]|nr:hypothetical protein SAMN02746093_01611 [Legionella quinlivanii DSM 21216]